MERLKAYCLDSCILDGLHTFIISPVKMELLVNDCMLLKALHKTDQEIQRFIKEVREAGMDRLYLAFVILPDVVEKFRWYPLYCYKSGDRFYHVHYRKTWVCRECGNVMDQSMVMPMAETDSIFVRYRNKDSDISQVFKKIKCLKCGKLLQNHWVVLE